MRFFTTTILLLLLYKSTTYAQPKREFRAVWVANVENIDWPSSNTLSSEEQRAELVALLDIHRAQGLNAVFLQIRNACDAVYPSKLEPWSEWLAGVQGLAPKPYYDPLEFAIQECRRRGMELHVWMNPYRAVTNTMKANIAQNHVSRTHPDWLRSYGTLRILDPGLPQVRAYVTRVVMDVLRRYDVDGIHFDDYFYPYPQAGLVFNDSETYRENNPTFLKRDDWRRNNVDLLIKAVSDSIRAVKPWVKFGVSPFGIWQNRSSSAQGSDSRGLESYSSIYADSQKWIERGWVDYAVPQIYWSIGNNSADFTKLAAWWNAHTHGRHVYVGHGPYKISNGDGDTRWRNPRQLANQINCVRKLPHLQGSAFFSSKILRNNPLGVGDSLADGSYYYAALVPTMPWKDNTPPAAPVNLIMRRSEKGIQLRWRQAAATHELDRVRSYAVYRFLENERVDVGRVENLIYVMGGEATSLLDEDVEPNQRYVYAVTALDRLHNESAPAQTVTENESVAPVATTATVTTTPPFPTKPTASSSESPPADTQSSLQVFPNPFNQQVSIRYSLAQATPVTLHVYDLNGTRVGVLVDGQRQDAGKYAVTFNGQFLSEGTYLARLITSQGVVTAKLTLTQ